MTAAAKYIDNRPDRSEVYVSVWEERDRLHIHLYKGDENNTVAEWWDDDARQMFEDGFFTRGRGRDESVIDYAVAIGLVR